MRSMIYESINQLTVAKLSLRVAVNHMHEAIILRTEGGGIGYLNETAVNLVSRTCRQVFTKQSGRNGNLSLPKAD